MNEPWAGNIYDEPELLVPGATDKQKLQPLYDQVNDAIRETDTEVSRGGTFAYVAYFHSLMPIVV